MATINTPPILIPVAAETVGPLGPASGDAPLGEEQEAQDITLDSISDSASLGAATDAQVAAEELRRLSSGVGQERGEKLATAGDQTMPKVVQALMAGAFQVTGLMTVSFLGPYRLSGWTEADAPEARSRHFYLALSDEDHPYIDRTTLHRIAWDIHSPPNWSDPRLFGPLEEPQALIVQKRDTFLQEHLKTFESLRAQAQFVSVRQGARVSGYRELMDWLPSTLVIGKLSCAKEFEYTPSASAMSFAAQKREVRKNILTTVRECFPDVGIEYVRSPEMKMSYFAIYRHIEDKGKAPPIYFVVYDDRKKKMIVFIDNAYQEQDEVRPYLVK